MPKTATKTDNQIEQEARRRRTFAIISHPDAGKTTLTEKLLLYGGAIHEAGSIRQRKASRYAASDWMAIEKERGISVTSSVLRFEKDNIKYNLLDTPGHKDFSEDTLRTLVAADTALMVIDVAKGVEEQTEKLFEVCKMREIPIITFVNKCDRPGLEPLDVIGNVENQLGIEPIPASWPLGYGKNFQGIYDLIGKKLHLQRKEKHGAQKATTEIYDLEEGLEKATLSDHDKEQFYEEVLLTEDLFEDMDRQAYLKGHCTPVFFGSALNNFGLDVFLNYFANLANPPQPYEDEAGVQRVLTDDFSGFVFKMQANMNPDHRDCAAFVRITSGMFERGLEVTQSGDSEKKIKMSTPHTLMGDERHILEEAYPGDVVSLFNPGSFRIGTSIYSGKPVNFNIIPLFTPEHFRKVSTKDPFKRKQLRQGLKQLAEEGVVHVFEVPNGVGNELLLGTVGALQFDVVQHRMLSEYNCELHISSVSYNSARWLPEDQQIIDTLESSYSTHVTKDMEGHPIVLFDSAYALNQAAEKVGGENLFKFKQN